MFLRHLILASIFSLSEPSIALNSSSVSPLKLAGGIGGGTLNIMFGGGAEKKAGWGGGGNIIPGGGGKKAGGAAAPGKVGCAPGAP